MVMSVNTSQSQQQPPATPNVRCSTLCGAALSRSHYSLVEATSDDRDAKAWHRMS